MPRGRNAGSGSTTTSRSTGTTTQRPIASCARKPRHASPRARSNCSTAASGLRRMCARPEIASTRRWRADAVEPPALRRLDAGAPQTQAGEIGKTPRRWSRSPRVGGAPREGFRAHHRILRLAKTDGHARLEAARRRAIDVGARSYSSVHSILKNNLDRRQPRAAFFDCLGMAPVIG